MKKLFIFGVSLLLIHASVQARSERPPMMGWSSWNTFRVNISEDIIKGSADALIEKGLDKVGYRYINIDDGFFGGRDEKGHLLAHPERFPNGMKVVADYIHSKGQLHRDISPKNILIKEYDDVVVVKIADFGLVKIPNSTFTTVNTEFKGYFNDPSLVVEGFNTYNMLHETYALTRVIYYVLTGKTNTDKITDQNLKNFVETGLNADKSKRFQNVSAMVSMLKKI